MHVCVRAYVYMYECVHMYSSMCVHVRAHVSVCMNKCVLECVCACMHVCVHGCICSCMFRYVCMSVHGRCIVGAVCVFISDCQPS